MRWEDICSRCGLCCHEKTIYPDEVLTPSLLGKIVCRGVELRVPSSDCMMIKTLDCMRVNGKELFGNGFLLSRRAAAERAAAERAAAERAAEQIREIFKNSKAE